MFAHQVPPLLPHQRKPHEATIVAIRALLLVAPRHGLRPLPRFSNQRQVFEFNPRTTNQLMATWQWIRHGCTDVLQCCSAAHLSGTIRAFELWTLFYGYSVSHHIEAYDLHSVLLECNDRIKSLHSLESSLGKISGQQLYDRHILQHHHHDDKRDMTK